MRKKIADLLKKMTPKGVVPEIFVPENEAHGHYSTNVAFRLAKEKNQPPMDIAKELRDKLAGSDLFTKVEAAPPGFLNFWISPTTLHEELGKVLKEGNKYGQGKPADQKIQVEFISANPTGPLTLANGRGGFLGDVLSNVLEWAGNEVEREYYVNDTGNQIITFGKSLIVALGLNLGQLSEQLGGEKNLYQGEYIKKWAKAHRATVKKYNADPLKLGQIAARDFLKNIQNTIEKKSRIKFNRYTSEAGIHRKNFVKKILELFRKSGKVYEQGGAIWLRTTDFGDDKDRVIVTSDGYPTYFLADAGHYLETQARGFDKKINILGPDHYGYVARIQAAAKIIGLNSEVIVTQAVRLMREGKEVKMSKRKGEFVTFEDLVREVGVDVARFFFLMVTPQTHMDFDLTLAKERSFKNPVYYAQYAYVRAKNILAKAKIIPKATTSLEPLNTEEDLKLIFEIVKLPEILGNTAKNYEVHHLTRYIHDLARVFHNFYEKERVIPARRSLSGGGSEKGEIFQARLVLVKAAEITFKNLFDILGVSAPKKM